MGRGKGIGRKFVLDGPLKGFSWGIYSFVCKYMVNFHYAPYVASLLRQKCILRLHSVSARVHLMRPCP